MGLMLFFFNRKYDELLTDTPKYMCDIYVFPSYHLYSAYGYKKFPRLVAGILKK